MNFDEIMERMLARIPNTFDKREGSVIWDALAPFARELEEAYAVMYALRKNTFAGTADRTGLIECCKEIGLEPMSATHAVRKGVFTPASLEIAIGERFNLDDMNFIIKEKIENGVYALECEALGTAGNYGTGTLIPINYINGLETATLVDEVIIYGEDEEGTEELRQRYFNTLPTFTIDGNIAQYEKWCRTFPGVGKYKIFPLWNGKNTVKASILSSENTVASSQLIADFQEYLDPDSEGLGNGQAPIGAVVTVSTATEKNIDFSAQLILREGYEKPVGLEAAIDDYFKSINYTRNAASYIAIGAIFQNNESIDSVVQLLINEGQVDIPLGSEEIAARGKLTYKVL